MESQRKRAILDVSLSSLNYVSSFSEMITGLKLFVVTGLRRRLDVHVETVIT